MKKYLTLIRKTWQLPTHTKKLFLRAIWFSFLLEFVGKEKLYQRVKAIQISENVERSTPLNSQDWEIIEVVHLCIHLLKKHAFWNPMCYNQALTTRKILSSYNIPSTLYIGFRKNAGEWDGHAWVAVEEKIVSGYRKDLHSFNVLK